MDDSGIVGAGGQGASEESVMTVGAAVAQFLQQNRNKPFCDRCIGKRLGLKRHQKVRQATMPLESAPSFLSLRGYCFECGAFGKTTMAR